MLKKLIKHWFFRWKYKGKNVKLAKTCNVNQSAELGGNNYIGSKSYFFGCIGYGSYLGSNCGFYGKIGKYCSIASGVKVVNGFHPTSEGISTHPAFYSTKNSVGLSYVKNNCFKEYRYADPEKKYAVVVGNDVWGKLLSGAGYICLTYTAKI